MPTETEAEAVHIALGEMISNKIKNWERCSTVSIIRLPSLYPLLPLIFPILVIPKVAVAGSHDLHKHPQSYVIERLKTHGIVFLGTTHKKEAILKFVAELIPRLHEAGTTHLGLEICSDQQTDKNRQKHLDLWDL